MIDYLTNDEHQQAMTTQEIAVQLWNAGRMFLNDYSKESCF